MCEGPVYWFRVYSEDRALAELCKDCLAKVDRRLHGTDKTLSDFHLKTYGFCPRCVKQVRKAFESELDWNPFDDDQA